MLSQGALVAIGLVGAVTVGSFSGRRHGAVIASTEVLVGAVVATAMAADFLPKQPTGGFAIAYALSRLFTRPIHELDANELSMWRALGFEPQRAARRLYLLPLVATFAALLTRQSPPSNLELVRIPLQLAVACVFALKPWPVVTQASLASLMLFALD